MPIRMSFSPRSDGPDHQGRGSDSNEEECALQPSIEAQTANRHKRRPANGYTRQCQDAGWRLDGRGDREACGHSGQLSDNDNAGPTTTLAATHPAMAIHMTPPKTIGVNAKTAPMPLERRRL